MADRGEYRSIHKSLLYGRDFQRLPAPAQLVFLALKVNLGPLGIDRFPGMAHALTECTPFDAGEVSRALVALETFRDAKTGEAHPWIRREGNVVWIVRGLEFEPSLDVTLQNHRKAFQRHVAGLPRIALVREFAEHYGAWLTNTGLDPLDLDAYPMASHSHPDAIAITETETITETEPYRAPRSARSPAGPARRAGAPAGDAPPGQPIALVRPSRPVPSRPREGPKGGKYPHFPPPECDRLYAAWSALGAPDYGRFRRAFARLYQREVPDFPVAELEAGIRDAIALAKAKGGYDLRDLKPESFVERAAHWVAYAKIPTVDPETRWLTAKGLELSGGPMPGVA
jgi:hypothetical protein